MKKSMVVTSLVLGLVCAFVVLTPGAAQAGDWSFGIGPGYIGVGYGHGHGHGHGYYHGGYHGGYYGPVVAPPIYHPPVYYGGYYPVYTGPVYGGCYGPSWGFKLIGLSQTVTPSPE